MMIIKGYASVYDVKDYHNDIIQPGSFQEDIDLFNKNQKHLLLLAHHNVENPIGKIIKLEHHYQGLYMEAVVEKNIYNEEIIFFLENQLIQDLSIGIIPVEYKQEKNHRIIKKAKLLEISLVTIGANPWAKIINDKIEFI